MSSVSKMAVKDATLNSTAQAQTEDAEDKRPPSGTEADTTAAPKKIFVCSPYPVKNLRCQKSQLEANINRAKTACRILSTLGFLPLVPHLYFTRFFKDGSYELKLVCPANGIHAESLVEGNIILAKPSDTGQSQPFRIYKVMILIDSKLEVQARHISYQLNFIIVSTFSVWTDIESSAIFAFAVPTSFRSCLGRSDASVQNTFSGEFEWDRYKVKFHRVRGAYYSVRIIYEKNLTDFKMEKSIEKVITGVHSYWVDSKTQTDMCCY